MRMPAAPAERANVTGGLVGPRLVARRRQLAALVQPLTDAIRWQPAVVAMSLVAVILFVKTGDVARTGSAVLLLQFVAIILASGACFVLDDDAADLLASSPATLAWRRLIRLAVGAALVALAWTPAVVVVTRRPGVDVPVLALTLELTALVVIGLAAAAALDRWSAVPDPAAVASPFVFAVALLAFRLPERWALFVPPGTGWGDAHLRWVAVLTTALLLLGWCTRDPAARALIRPRDDDRVVPRSRP